MKNYNNLVNTEYSCLIISNYLGKEYVINELKKMITNMGLIVVLTKTYGKDIGIIVKGQNAVEIIANAFVIYDTDKNIKIYSKKVIDILGEDIFKTNFNIMVQISLEQSLIEIKSFFGLELNIFNKEENNKVMKIKRTKI